MSGRKKLILYIAGALLGITFVGVTLVEGQGSKESTPLNDIPQNIKADFTPEFLDILNEK